MSATAFLLRRMIVNWVKDLKNKPQMIVLIVVVAGLLAMAALPVNAQTDRYSAPLVESIFFVVALVFGATTVYGGLSETRSFFRMADVNLLFPAPVRPAHVIFYGMLRNIGSLAFSMLLLVYQINTLRFSLGMPPAAIFWGFACLFFGLLVSLTSSMCLMLFCSGRPERLRACKYGLGALVAVLFLYALPIAMAGRGKSPSALFAAICASPWLDVFPIAGWSRGLYAGITGARPLLGAVCGGALFVLLGAELWGIAHTKTDYYEDVLDGASRREQMLTAKKSGRRMKAFVPRKEKTLHSFGIAKGAGASAFYYKRMLERRRGAFGLIGTSNILVACIAVALAFFFRMPFAAFLGISAGVCLIFRRFASWEGELDKVYLYLAPASAVCKLFFVVLPDFLSALITGAVALVAGAALFQTGFPAAVAGALALFSVEALLVGSSVLIRRLFGNDSKNVLVQLLLVYVPMILVGIGLIPAAIVQATVFPGQTQPVAACLLAGVWDLLAAGLLLFCGRGLLDRAEAA